VRKNSQSQNIGQKLLIKVPPNIKKRWRDLVYLFLPDGLMVFLAIVLVPVVLIPWFVNLSDNWLGLFRFIDYSILGIYILEYTLKTVLAQNVIKHIINPWHLLDLIIIVLPLVSFLPITSAGLSVHSPLLRLLRIVRLVAVGGRTVDRRIRMTNLGDHTASVKRSPMIIKVLDGQLESAPVVISVDKIPQYLQNKSNTWIDISSISEHDLASLSSALNISKLILESELEEESYPRVDYFENYSMIFTRIADYKILEGENIRLQVNRTGLLVICYGPNIITLSTTRTEAFDKILEKARKLHSDQNTTVVTVLYSLLKHVLEKNKRIITALEQQLMDMESEPLKNRPSNFLETTFYLRKEVNQLVPALLHLKEVLSIIADKRVPLAGFNESHEKIFDILLDEAGYQHETATSARDNLLSLIDLYINTTSYEMNKVMRIIAVITCLGIIPAVMGLLGSNILGNPWNIQLWQVFGILGSIMIILVWIFYRLGWLKG
jgi:Mg2+ and Co2+ transporter CorA